MKQSFQLNTENPCQEQWESFKPTTTGGFCGSCQKNVIDFSKMSESQLVAFFKDRLNSAQNLCGRFREDQLRKNYVIEEWFPTWNIQNDQVQYEIPVAVITQQKQAISLPLIRHMKVVRNMAAAVLTLLYIEEGIGQKRVLSGQVIDAEGKEALQGVSISVKGTKRGTVTDSIGNYRISVSDNDTLIFSFIGYEFETRKISGETKFIKTELTPAVMGFSEIVVAGYASTRKTMGTGGVSLYCDFEKPQPLKKYASKITVHGNAVQNGELILVAELVASKDSTGNSFERTNDEKWFSQNGFQQITSVQLYDYSGRVFQERFTKLNDGMISIDVKDLPPGAYVARVVYKNERSLTEQEISTTRVLIER
ncbi:T9SS type A sorting domain-containing protein [Emticicia agri]|uniref:Carboxypeptidase-like regulatory domain-containing protein n=1 Tax=Emticicia agri TaxID=2492393 RepID=A0A4Q5M4Y9_9BACT|nr:T9SS type A sorting domain-containing protein [Emticicia agri]RYU97468.1 hypothetical protein EWM59_01905 [Emticicia agri]